MTMAMAIVSMVMVVPIFKSEEGTLEKSTGFRRVDEVVALSVRPRYVRRKCFRKVVRWVR